MAERSALCIETSKKKEKKSQHRTKKRGKQIKVLQKKLRKENQQSKSEKKTQQLLLTHLGSLDAVTENRYRGKRSFTYKCPECSLFIKDKLARHLVLKHECKSKEAKMEHTRMRIMYLWCMKPKHATVLPLPCEPCGEWHLRLDNHLKTHGVHRLFETEEAREKILCDTKKKYWVKNQAATSSTRNDISVEEPKFIRRSRPEVATVSAKDESIPLRKTVGYTPGASLMLTDQQKADWKISREDFFTIYFETAEDLLDKFQTQLVLSGHKHDNAVCHKIMLN